MQQHCAGSQGEEGQQQPEPQLEPWRGSAEMMEKQMEIEMIEGVECTAYTAGV